MKPIVMTEEFWANSQLSLARYYGRIKFGGHEYIIVDKRGWDIFACSIEAERLGREKAIEPGEPADLCRVDFVPLYKKMGRDAFLQFIKDHPEVSTPKQAMAILKATGK